MDKDFKQYVLARIEGALTENEEYMELQNKCCEAAKNNDTKLYENLTCGLECKAEELCYLKGYSDAMKMVLDNLK